MYCIGSIISVFFIPVFAKKKSTSQIQQYLFFWRFFNGTWIFLRWFINLLFERIFTRHGPFGNFVAKIP